MNLSQLLNRQSIRYADQPFVLFERQPGLQSDDRNLEKYQRSLSYGEFESEVNQTANYLISIGVKPGQVYNLHLPNSISFLLLWFAGMRIGAVMMPTNVLASQDELSFMLAHSESVISFTTTEYLDLVEAAAANIQTFDRVICCDPFNDQPAEDSFEFNMGLQIAEFATTDFSDRQLASIMYTSGTTSKPKGVMVSHANYIKAGQTVVDAIALDSTDRHFVVLPLFHGNAQYYSTMSALLAGASMALMDRFSASQYFYKCIEYQCSIASLFAAPMRMILAQPIDSSQKKNGLRIVLYAQNLTETQMQQWQQRFGDHLCQLWGMTETMGPPLMNPLHGKRLNRSIGKPVGDYRILLANESGEIDPQITEGQIVVQGEPGKTIMLGYFKNAEATNQTLRDGWLYTGDNAHKDDQGYYFFVDRLKDMIKRSGENVSAGEVESVILDHSDVYECAVIGMADEIRDEEIVAIVVCQPDIQQSQDQLAKQLLALCQSRLAKFRVPGKILFRTSLPKTSVGKIQKHLLKSEFTDPH